LAKITVSMISLAADLRICLKPIMETEILAKRERDR